MPGLTPAEVLRAQTGGVLLVDTRPLQAHITGHVPGAVTIELNLADLSERAALLLPAGLSLLVHAEPESALAPSVGLLADAGFQVDGHLQGGLAAWHAAGLPSEPLPTIEPDALRAAGDAYRILDVREPFEYRHGHLAGSVLLPSGEAFSRSAADWASDADGRPYAVFCSGWGRAAFVTGLLRTRGIDGVLVSGGMYAWTQRGLPVVGSGA